MEVLFNLAGFDRGTLLTDRGTKLNSYMNDDKENKPTQTSFSSDVGVMIRGSISQKLKFQGIL